MAAGNVAVATGAASLAPGATGAAIASLSLTIGARLGVAEALGVAPDAMLLAVLIGTSSDFLTPIGHQNNLLVMGPGGYRFVDYARMGAMLAVLVVVSTALFLAWSFG